MRSYPIPFNDPARLAALRGLPGLDATVEPMFEKLTDAARVLFDCPVAHISLVEEETQWFKSVVGVELPTIPRDHSFCTHAIMSDDFLVVPDLAMDPRFVNHPMVANAPHVRFYAGAPIILSTGFRVGSLCALDFAPHEPPSQAALATLRALTDAVAAAFERDMTEVEAQAVDRDRGQREFAALIGHEFRTPLTKVLGYSKILAAQLDGSQRDLALASASAGEHMRELLEAIITYTNIATGDMMLNETRTDLRAIIEDALLVQGPEIDGAGKTVALTRYDIPGPVQVDPVQIKLALAALIENAQLHGGNALQLTAALGEGGEIEIAITDDGQMKETVKLEELYKPFRVGGALDTRTVGGLGLGLPLTRKLVELHGGEFTVVPGDSQTVAMIRLPAWRALGDAT